MNKEIRDNWVAALRSGKYKQGKSTLMYEGKYCCLGVLCDILGIKLVSTTREKDHYNESHYERVRHITGGNHELIYMNDHGESFSKIADYIDNNL